MATRNGSAKWTGDLRTGSGELTVGEGAWTSAYSGSSRFHGVLPGFEDGAGTNPEELLAAAHAGCFSMALSAQLGQANLTAESIRTTCTITLERQGDSFAITESHLELKARVPGATREAFHKAVEAAKT